MAKSNKHEIKDIPLRGDYALDANDNPIEVYEDRSGRRTAKKSLISKLVGGKGK